jgi:hypothetical protein
MGLWKDIKLYFTYARIVRENEEEIEQKFNMRVDNAARLYTVLNIPVELFDEPYNVRKADIDTISKKYIQEFITQLSGYLDSKELKELYGFDQNIEKKDKYSYLVVIGYKRLDSRSLLKTIYGLSGFLLIGLIVSFFLLFS